MWPIQRCAWRWRRRGRSRDIKQEQMERSTIPETTLYIKRGQMERDLLLCMKRRERRERKKKSSRESDVSTIESANDPCKLPVKVTKVWQSWCNVPCSRACSDLCRELRDQGWAASALVYIVLSLLLTAVATAASRGELPAPGL